MAATGQQHDPGTCGEDGERLKEIEKDELIHGLRLLMNHLPNRCKPRPMKIQVAAIAMLTTSRVPSSVRSVTDGAINPATKAPTPRLLSHVAVSFVRSLWTRSRRFWAFSSMFGGSSVISELFDGTIHVCRM